MTPRTKSDIPWLLPRPNGTCDAIARAETNSGYLAVPCEPVVTVNCTMVVVRFGLVPDTFLAKGARRYPH